MCLCCIKERWAAVQGLHRRAGQEDQSRERERQTPAGISEIKGNYRTSLYLRDNKGQAIPVRLCIQCRWRKGQCANDEAR